MHTFLLELGTEELPIAFIEAAPQDFRMALGQLLATKGIESANIVPYAAPRRLAWVVGNLPAHTAAQTIDHKGPPLSVALNAQGSPTPAGLGFAKKLGVPFEALAQTDGYLTYTQTVAGQPLQALLREQLPVLVEQLTGSHFMRWQPAEVSAFKFSRPIRWVTALWDDAPLNVEIAGCPSGMQSYGLRLLGDAPIEIPHANAYQETLCRQGGLEPDEAKRREHILLQFSKAAEALGGSVATPAGERLHNSPLLDTVTRMNESATVFCGTYDEKFLALPKAVLITVLAAHQKLFAIENGDGQLLPRFLGVSNNPRPEAQATIIAGNERVVRARFEDAQFFFETDVKQSLEAYAQKLDGVTFQRGLGTMADKATRLQQLVLPIAKALGLTAEQTQHAQRAAQLCKADLTTLLVREFTELQGEIGGEYARKQGEPEPVCQAIAEQYYPRFAGDFVPKAPVAMALNLADKIDTLVAVFSQKNAKLPTGSKDPLGLRRAASGVLQLIQENDLTVSLTDLFGDAHALLGNMAAVSANEMLALLVPFIEQRAKADLKDAHQASHALVEAACAIYERPLNRLIAINKTLRHLRPLLAEQKASLITVIAGATRVARILGETQQASDPNPALFEADAERALFRTIEAVKTQMDQAKSTEAYIDDLVTLSQPIDAFFDAVMVNADDPAVKANRLALLGQVQALYHRVAKFSVL
ncbi:MAG: glycine--tRNA ligase subunit beta [Vampirovibrionales bacterium]|nr:glycine--tRNA ligase subunit beta [Vampirovibrionales bacterium]